MTGAVIYQLLDAFWLLTGIFVGSSWMAVGAVLMASFVPVITLAKIMEGRSLRKLIKEFRKQSYAFLFGDSIFLPLAAAMIAQGWHTLRPDGWHNGWWWPCVAAVAGLAMGYWFRYIDNLPEYRKHDAMGAFVAPSKLLHDGAYPMLVSVFTGTLLPLFFDHATVWPPQEAWLALLGGLLWFGAALWHDSGLRGPKLNPNDLHSSNWQWPWVIIIVPRKWLQNHR